MNSMSIKKKIFYIVLVSSIVFMVCGFGISKYFVNAIEKDVYEKTKVSLSNVVMQQELSKHNVGITNALSVANNEVLANAIIDNDREKAKMMFEGLGTTFKENTEFKNIKIHVHTKDTKSFLRSWDFAKFGDDLSDFRFSIVEVNNTKKALSTIEAGRDGLLFRGVAPIFDNDNKHVGSVEFVQAFESVIKTLKADYKYDMLVLVNKKVTEIANKGEWTKPVGEYYVSQKSTDEAFYTEAKTIDISKLKKDGYYVGKDYFYSYAPIMHFKNGEQGIYLIGEKLSVVREAVSNAEKIVYAFEVLIIALIAVLLLVFFSSLYRYVLRPLSSLQVVLESFFDYLNRKTNDVEIVHIDNYDEIGTMMAQINENIRYTKESYQKDINLIAEVSDVIEKVENGFYTYSVKGSTNNPQIEALKVLLNRMINDTNEKLNRVSHALQEYGLSRFNHKMDMNGMYGNFGSVAASTKLLGNNVSELLAMIMNTGDKLHSSITVLSTSANALSTSSNQQASSLEETAASLEQISANIKHTVEQSQEMAKIAQDTKESANKGSILSTQTAKAMGEINQSTLAINDAITVIDQIAFQTNILSLNAAVEAATAGEAGKGFAVVAGEVRNLANRSSEAAKEIKNLVEQARVRANEGIIISEQMKNGFDELNERITSTSSLVENVANASKEQLSGVSQINDALSELDKETQDNARVAHEISDLANEIVNMADSLTKAASKAEFNQDARRQVCDVDLVYATAKLKLDHVALKERAFANLDKKSSQTILEHTSCDLGKWIQQQGQKPFAKGNNWNAFLEAHKNVHEYIQKYVDANAKNANNKELREISRLLEAETIKVFDSLNEIKRVNCGTVADTQTTQIQINKHNHKKIDLHHKDKKVDTKKVAHTHNTTNQSSHNHDQWDTF